MTKQKQTKDYYEIGKMCLYVKKFRMMSAAMAWLKKKNQI